MSVENYKDFDDILGFYKFNLHDYINNRYEILKSINKGIYSEVIFAYDWKWSRNVAIKISRSIEDNLLKFYEETHKLQVLNEVIDDKWIVKMNEHFIFRGHACIVFELLLNNLGTELKKNSFKGFSILITKEILKSVLHGLKILGKISLVHCDLNPDNLVFVKRNEYEVKIVDFGNSVFVGENHLVGRICQDHSSPEMFLKLPFGLPNDMWSLGCLAVNLFTGTPIFMGSNVRERIENIVRLIGVPPPEFVATCEATNNFSIFDKCPKSSRTTDEKTQCWVTDDHMSPKTLAEILAKSSSPGFIDFVTRCLTWKPDERMTPEEALNHPWMNDEISSSSQN